ncbi:hypothetical protein [Mesoplasma melaleucae]|uniref:Uncharacterized protein n=1 Tax=Mesoplasma melaleucae TaxID=81459 RepID=A0A2K8NX71_9MOLU|nr:hypothetical protein [Mesoplasma melaleucae]ATZ17788.1 hypothetical protein EMELA_v1c02150 [Mesoplasma melaleucae]
MAELFSFYKNWISEAELKAIGFIDDKEVGLTSEVITRATIYGAYTLDKNLSGGRLSKKIGNYSFEETPNLTNYEKEEIRNCVAILAKQVLDYGADEFLRGSTSVNMGNINVSQTNPEDPFYIPLSVIDSMINLGLYVKLKGVNIEPYTNTGIHTPFNTIDDSMLNNVSFDWAKRNLISKNEIIGDEPLYVKISQNINGMGYGNIKIGLNPELIGNWIIDNLIQNIINEVIKNGLEEDVAIAILQDENNFWQPLLAALELDNNLQSLLSEKIKELINNDNEFIKLIVNGIYPQVKDELKTDTQFITDISNNSINNIKNDATLKQELKGDKGDKGNDGTISNINDINLSSNQTIINLQNQINHLNNTSLWNIFENKKFNQYGFRIGTKFKPSNLDFTRPFIFKIGQSRSGNIVISPTIYTYTPEFYIYGLQVGYDNDFVWAYNDGKPIITTDGIEITKVALTNISQSNSLSNLNISSNLVLYLFYWQPDKEISVFKKDNHYE